MAIRLLLALLLFLLAFPGLKAFVSALTPDISFSVFVWAYISSALFLMGAATAVEALLEWIGKKLYFWGLKEEEEDNDDDDFGDDEFEHSPAAYDKDGRPYCPDCHAYLDERGGYYATNREERRRLKREGLL